MVYTGSGRMSKQDLLKTCQEDINKLAHDIEVLESIIESKQQDIADLMKVIYALEQVNEKYLS
jgi:uncharacterized protein YaaN involved in tellurite resistance